MDSTPSRLHNGDDRVTGERVATASAGAPHVHAVTGARLEGRWHHAARGVWVALAVLTACLFIAGVATEMLHVRTLCPTASCRSGALTPAMVRELRRIGLPPAAYASLQRSLQTLGLTVGFYFGYVLALSVIFSLVYVAVAVLLFWRRSDHVVALFASLALLTFGLATFPNVIQAVATEHPAWRLLTAVVALVGSAAIGLFFYLFPEGSFVPRWMLWVAIAWVAWQFPHYVFAGSLLDEAVWPGVLTLVMWLAFFSTMVFAQTYRYHHVSTPEQQQQTKWVVYGVSVALVGYYSLGLLSAIFLPPTSLTPAAVAASLILVTISYGFMLVVPVSIGIAILRHRLFDIDLIINRTLVYGALAGLLAIIYQGTLVVIGSLFLSFTGQETLVANVISTVVIGALFEPLRRRIQRLVDRYLVHLAPQPATS